MPDIFNINIIKTVEPHIIPGLVIICNNSINERTFPEMLKIAKVIPVHKKNDEFVTGNYRPISLLSVFHKLLEKLMYKRLKSFLETHDFSYKYQYGFRTNHSTINSCIGRCLRIYMQCFG